MLTLNLIEFTSQFECLPNGAPIPGVPRGSPPAFAPYWLNSPSTHQSPIPSSSAPAGTSHLVRSRSPPISNVLGYGLDQVEFIRLIPYKNPQRQFKLRRYTFPAVKTIQLLVSPNMYEPIPTEEQIVLSTSDGEVFAILDDNYSLAGIYTYNHRTQSRGRAKINMMSSQITSLTADEIRETPVGANRQLFYGYRVEHVNQSHGSLSSPEQSLGSISSSSPMFMSLPTRLPSSDGCAYGLDQIHSIRLIPRKNPNQIFGLQRYNFPVNKPLFLHQERNYYQPIPMQELIVLATLPGDVFAILESRNHLAGIYTYDSRAKVRAKINMRSGTIVPLTKDEMKEVQVGRLRTIMNNFRIQHLNNNPRCHPLDSKK